MTRVRLVLIAVLSIVLLGATAATFDAQEEAHPPHVEPAVSAGHPGSQPDVWAAYELVVGALEAQRIELEIEAAVAIAEETARLEAARRPANVSVVSSGTRVACEGLELPAEIAWRESNCTRGINTGNGYFGYGQVAGFHWAAGGICEGLSWLIPEQEDECIRRLRNAGGLRPWGQ